MAYRTIPYTVGMQLGQRVNTYIHPSPSFVGFGTVRDDVWTFPATRHFRRVDNQEPLIGSRCCPSDAGENPASTPTSSRWEQVDDGADRSSCEGSQSRAAQNYTSPAVTHASFLVERLSEITTDAGVSGAVPILNHSSAASGHGLPFDLDQFYNASFNYYLGVKVVTNQTHLCSDWTVPATHTDSYRLTESLADAYLSGFVQGGHLSALVSFQVNDLAKRADAISAALSVLELRNGQFSPLDHLQSDMQVLTENCKVTIHVWQNGGTPIIHSRQIFTLQSLREAFSEFPNLATERSAIFAVMTIILDHIPVPESVRREILCYNHAGLYTNMLLDAYFHFAHIDCQISSSISAIKAGTMRFDNVVYSAISTSSNAQGLKGKALFEPSVPGMAKARWECVAEMTKIVNEVKEVAKHPENATNVTRNGRFQDPLEFLERLPRARSVPHEAGQQIPRKRDLICSPLTLLSLPERNKVTDILNERPNCGEHFQLAQPSGSDHGEIFCSLDFLKPEWVPFGVSITVVGSVICSIGFRYANGVSTLFGTSTDRGKKATLNLDIHQREKIISCSIEVGRRASKIDSRLRITAVFLSTNRGSILRGHADDWAPPHNGVSIRGSVRFQDLQMVQYDPPMNNGYITGFWGRTPLEPDSHAGIYRAAPVWCEMDTTIRFDKDTAELSEEEDGGLTPDVLPCGVWDTTAIHDWQSPMERTSEVLAYQNHTPKKALPSIMVGFAKMDTWNKANMRFACSTESVTAENFTIGVDQWSDSLFYTGLFSWIGIPPDNPNIQAGIVECRGRLKRRFTFGRPFRTAPQMLTWISGLDLSIKVGRQVKVVATAVSKNGFTLDVSCAKSAARWASITWIALTADAGCATGSFVKDSDGVHEKDVQRGHCSFPIGLFTKPPTVLLAFNSFDISGSDSNPRFETSCWHVTTEGFIWRINTWEGSSIHRASVQWLAVPSL